MELTDKDTKWRLRKKIYGMILPMTIENVLQMLAGFVAMAMIGRISDVAISALGLSMRVTQIVWALFKGVTTGGTVYIAQAYGANDYKKLKSVVQQTLLSTVIPVIFLQQLIYWNAPLLIRGLGAKGDLLQNGALYLKTISWGLPFMAIMLVVTGVMQGMGNAKTPMKIALIMNLINIVGNYLLIFGKFGFPALGVKGSAIGTAFAQLVGAGIGIYILFSKHGPLEGMFNFSFFTMQVKRITEIYKMGIPTAFESIFWQMATIIFTRLILTFGVTALAAHQLGLQAEAISYMPAMGFSVAATAFVGQAIGARDPELGRKYLREIMMGSVLVTSASVVLLFFFPAWIMGLLTNQKEVIELGVKYLMLMAVVQIPQNASGVLNGALRGAGFTKIPMIVAGTGIWLVRLPLAYVLSIFCGLNIIGIWIAMTIDLGFRFCLSYGIYRRKNIYGELKEKPLQEACEM